MKDDDIESNTTNNKNNSKIKLPNYNMEVKKWAIH